MKPIDFRATHGRIASLVLVVIAAISPTVALAEAPEGKASTAATGERFVAAINAADGAALNELLDVDAIGERVLRNLDLNAVDRTRYLAGLRMQHATLGYSVATQMAQQRAKAVLVKSPSGAANEFMARVTTTDARGNKAHGYLQVELGPDGRIVEWYDHALAMSTTGQLAFSAAGLLTTEQVARLFLGKDIDAAATAVSMQAFTRAITAGDMRRAHDALLKLPEELQARREFATLRIALARSVGMDAYRTALAELAKRHAAADDLQLILIDHYLLGGEFEQAMKAVERGARIIGEDEVTDSNRCTILWKLERKADAVAACDRSIARNPKFDSPRWTRVMIAVESKDAPLAIESLEGVEEATGERLDAADLGEMDFYKAWMVKQPEWAAWATERGWKAAAE